jgi:hypothetical protein
MGRMQFIHIGKTGGSYVFAVLRSLPPEQRRRFTFLGHSSTLAQALAERPDEPVLFSVRRPETLFVSAFNSRLRQGRPTYDRPWTPREEVAFSVFGTPNQLAEALSAEDPFVRASARLSMLGINHVWKGLRWFLHDVDTLEQHRDMIAFVMVQESLEEDISAFAERYDLAIDRAALPAERIHASPPEADAGLSEQGLANIRDWYREDSEIYEWCVRFRALTGRRSPA